MNKLNQFVIFSIIFSFVFSFNMPAQAGGGPGAEVPYAEKNWFHKTVDQIGGGIGGLIDPGTDPGFQRFVTKLGQSIDESMDRIYKPFNYSGITDFHTQVADHVSGALVGLHVNDHVNTVLDHVEGFAKGSGMKDLYPHFSQGPMTVKGYFKTKMQFEHNVFYEPNPDREDVVWTHTPGVTTNLPYGDQNQHVLATAYEARFVRYTKFTQHDDIGQTFRARTYVQMNDDTYIRAVEELIADAARPATLNTKRIEYRTQRVAPVIGHNWREWNFEVGYESLFSWFVSKSFDQFEYEKNSVNVNATRNLAKDFKGTFEYYVQKYDYKKDVRRSGRVFQIMSGLTGKVSPRTSLTVKAGFMDRDYKLQESADFRKAVGQVSLNHRLSQRTSMSLFMHRTANETSFTNNRFYDERRLAYSLTHLFNRKLRARYGLSYANRDFEVPAQIGVIRAKRVDNIFDASLAVDYALRPWMVFTTGYKYERRDSNISTFDYTNHILSTELSMPF